jgi:hypothetical protein
MTRIGEGRNEYTDLAGSLSDRDHVEEIRADGMIILKWILKK